MSFDYWEVVHDEHIKSNITLRILVRRGDDNRVLFERDDAGLGVSCYFNATDAIRGEFRISEICYGWDVIMSEDKDQVRSQWLDRVSEHMGSAKPLTCAHDGYTCEQMFHTAQVILGNEDEDNCGTCQRYGLNTSEINGKKEE